MIDPTARNWLFRLYRVLPANRFGLMVLHVMGWLASKQRPSGVRIWQDVIDIGGRRVPAFVLAPEKATGPLPIVVHLHGGGYPIGRPDQDLALMGHYIGLRPAIFVAPKYRRSLQAPYPAALDDAYACLLWAKAQSAALGGDPARIFVMGESAGGGLAAALTLRARDRGEVAIAGQFPLYAMLEDRADRFTSRAASVLSWGRDMNLLAWRLYLGAGAGGPDAPQEAAPARAKDLHGLPPAIGMVGDQDLFLDENRAYFDRLAEAGVSTNFRVFAGAYHAAELLSPGSDVGQEMRHWMDAAYCDAMDNLRAEQPD